MAYFYHKQAPQQNCRQHFIDPVLHHYHILRDLSSYQHDHYCLDFAIMSHKCIIPFYVASNISKNVEPGEACRLAAGGVDVLSADYHTTAIY